MYLLQTPACQVPRPSATPLDAHCLGHCRRGPHGHRPRTNKGHCYVLVVTDLFSRWVEAFPWRTSTAAVITKVMKEEVFSRWGYPRRILSDNGTQFTGHIWAEASQRWDCQLWTTPVYHPRANPTERRNQEIKKGLRLPLTPHNQRTWDQHLPELLFGLRRRQNAATGDTPSYLLLGKTLPAPGEWRLENTEPAKDPAASRQQRQTQACQHQERYQERFTAEPTEPRYSVGDWVVTTNHQLSNKAAGYNAALDHKRIGPYQITGHSSGDVYWIRKDGQNQKVHGKDLWPVPPARRPLLPINDAEPAPAPEDEEDPSVASDDSPGSDEEEDSQPATTVADHIGKQPYAPSLDRAQPVPVEDIHAPGPSGPKRPKLAVPSPANDAAQARHHSYRRSPYASSLDRAQPVPVEDIHAPGPSGPKRPKLAVPSPANDVAQARHHSYRRSPYASSLDRAQLVPV